ncbi:MAG: TlpA family protein disulfide reductase [Betaproteobacteria bacterium]|nr:TlpA family protein disulfide reductase [Betaproteobacteria bacterium]
MKALTILFIATFLVGATVAAAEDVGKWKPGETPPYNLGLMRDGTQLETTQFNGKVLVVTFWASWCGPCKKELPMLEGLQNAGRGSIQVVAINIEDRDRFQVVSKALSSLNLKLSHDYRKRSSDAYGVNGIPHLVLIGRDGKIITVHRGYSEEAIDSIIAEINQALARG